MALTDLTRISTSGIATGTSLSGAILHGDAHFRGTQVGVTSALFDSSDDALEFNDNVKLKIGTHGDIQIYNDGTKSVIKMVEVVLVVIITHYIFTVRMIFLLTLLFHSIFIVVRLMKVQFHQDN